MTRNPNIRTVNGIPVWEPQLIPPDDSGQPADELEVLPCSAIGAAMLIERVRREREKRRA